MQSVPAFKVGDRVRCMQTDDNVKIGIANKRGTITEIRRTKSGDTIYVLPNDGSVTIEIDASALMKV